ncbi:hypothetical protein ACH4SP_12470, partial [Streptomyces sp. NPDC021093]
MHSEALAAHQLSPAPLQDVLVAVPGAQEAEVGGEFVLDHGQKMGIDVEVVERNLATSGFVPQPKRW